MRTDFIYQTILDAVSHTGEVVKTRNAITHSLIDLPTLSFSSTPLVTVRKTAWKKALREMEWFMSGESKCPDELLSWWKDQLDSEGYYAFGYPKQFRHQFAANSSEFDQVKFILSSLRSNPNSRRLVMTTWNSWDMANITRLNRNNNTPSTCHGTIIQFFVRDNCLSIKTYQRSADLVVGVPHNWIQYWALLLYFAHWTNLGVGKLYWMFGDAHIYEEESHLSIVKQILNLDLVNYKEDTFHLEYNPTVKFEDVPEFKASDFVMIGEVPEPIIKTAPVLLV